MARCAPMSSKALTSLAAAETELRELRSAGTVFGLLDIDDEFFLIVRPAPARTQLLLSDATAALDYDIAAGRWRPSTSKSPGGPRGQRPFRRG